MNTTWIKILFYVAGIYDGVLGIAFLFCSPDLFQISGVAPPNHYGYVHFPALLLITFAVMYFQIARNPAGNRDLMLYGSALKVAYSGTVFWYQWHGGIPILWIPWAWADLVFLALFLVAWKQTEAK